MSANLNTTHWEHLSKQQRYDQVNSQVIGLIDHSVDEIANLANACALLKEAFGWWWIGFYRKVNNSLVLGPFQGPVACTTIGFGKGVCGSSWKEGRTILVEDVESFLAILLVAQRAKVKLLSLFGERMVLLGCSGC